jgi:hypothetical protein
VVVFMEQQGRFPAPAGPLDATDLNEFPDSVFGAHRSALRQAANQ